MWSGFLVFVLLNALAWAAASAVALRAQFSGSAERLLATFAGWSAVVTYPTLVLGWTKLLYRPLLALTVAIISAAALAASYRGVAMREHSFRILASFREAITLPIRGVVISFRRGSLIGVGVLASALVILYTAWLSYLAPSSGWDGIWYHDTIVGFAIQTHSLRAVEMPLSLQNANGFPRVCEAMNLWFVIFTDRRFIEGVNSVMSIPLILACYTIARRYGDALLAMGWAAALFLMPGLALELRSTYIDLHALAIFLIAVHFATRPKLRIRDSLYAAAYIGLLSGTKGMALAWAPILGAVLIARLARLHLRTRPWATVGVTALAAVFVIIAAVPTYLQNWLLFHNPVWPIVIDNARFNIHWPGNTDVMGLNRPVGQMIHDMLTVPVPGHDWHDTRVWGYGLGLPFLVLPISAVALVLAVAVTIGAMIRRKRDHVTENLLIVVLPLLLTMKFSPALWSARYNLHVAFALMLLVHWLASRRPLWRLGEGAAATTIITSLMMLWWSDPGWDISFEKAVALAKETPEQRAAFPSSEFLMAPQTVAAREREIGPGDVVVYTDNYMFPSLFWNERFTNRVVYIPSQSPEEFVRRVDEVGAKWVIVGSPSAESVALQEHNWELIGEASHTLPLTVAFRRKRGS